jgi:ATP-binding cassette subfamily C protein CydD
VINRVFLHNATLQDVQGWLVGMLLLALLRFGVLWGNEIAAQHVTGAIKSSLRERLFRQLFALGPFYAAGERSGELVSTLTEGVEALDAYFRQYLPQLFLMLLIPLVMLVVVFPLDVFSGAVLLVTAPLLPVFMILIGQWAGTVSRSQFQTMSFLSAHFLDVMQGLTTLKLFNRSLAQTRTIAHLSDDFRVATMHVLRVAFLSALALELLTTLSVAIIAVEIGLRLLYHKITFEQAFFVLVLAPEFYQPIRNFGASFHASASGLSAAQRIFEILDSSPVAAVTQEGTPEKIEWIRFENVSYTYPQQTQPALRNLTFEIPGGQRVAIVGESGAGKSTLAGLLLRFMEPTTGQIIINGVSLAHMNPAGWRQKIAWVSQRPYLFNASLLENLRLAKPDASLDEIFWAAEQADMLSFVKKFPLRWETPIGERGAHLSGGQAQRLALARAFLKDAPILLWDEATAHLDVHTEERVLQALARLRRTTILITHRLHTTVDHVIVLSHGEIINGH